MPTLFRRQKSDRAHNYKLLACKNMLLSLAGNSGVQEKKKKAREWISGGLNMEQS